MKYLPHEWTSFAACVAVAVYVLKSLPSIFSSGILGGLLCFCAGVLATVLAALVALVILWHGVMDTSEDPTQTMQPAMHEERPLVGRGPLARLGTFTRAASLTLRGGGRSTAAQGIPRHSGRNQRKNKGIVVLQAGSAVDDVSVESVEIFSVGPTKPHPATYMAGSYRGTLWTVPASAWPRDQLMPQFPPESEGPSAVAHKWMAQVSHGVLYLEPVGEVKARNKMAIKLSSCKCNIVRECLLKTMQPSPSPPPPPPSPPQQGNTVVEEAGGQQMSTERTTVHSLQLNNAPLVLQDAAATAAQSCAKLKLLEREAATSNKLLSSAAVASGHQEEHVQAVRSTPASSSSLGMPSASSSPSENGASGPLRAPACSQIEPVWGSGAGALMNMAPPAGSGAVVPNTAPPAGPKKSPWMKRGPLELVLISSETRELEQRGVPGSAANSVPDQSSTATSIMYGEDRVFLFAESAAAKEQWYITLSVESSPSGQEARVRSMYQAFNHNMVKAADILGIQHLFSVHLSDDTMATSSTASGHKISAPQTAASCLQNSRVSSTGSQGEPENGAPAAKGIGKRFGWLARLVPGRRSKPPLPPPPPPLLTHSEDQPVSFHEGALAETAEATVLANDCKATCVSSTGMGHAHSSPSITHLTSQSSDQGICVISPETMDQTSKQAMDHVSSSSFLSEAILKDHQSSRDVVENAKQENEQPLEPTTLQSCTSPIPITASGPINESAILVSSTTGIKAAGSAHNAHQTTSSITSCSTDPKLRGLAKPTEQKELRDHAFPTTSWVTAQQYKEGSQAVIETGILDPALPASLAVDPALPTSLAVDPDLPTSLAVDPDLPTSLAVDPDLPTSLAVDPDLPTGLAVDPALPTSLAVDPALGTVSINSPQGSAGGPPPPIHNSFSLPVQPLVVEWPLAAGEVGRSLESLRAQVLHSIQGVEITGPEYKAHQEGQMSAYYVTSASLKGGVAASSSPVLGDSAPVLDGAASGAAHQDHLLSQPASTESITELLGGCSAEGMSPPSITPSHMLSRSSSTCELRGHSPPYSRHGGLIQGVRGGGADACKYGVTSGAEMNSKELQRRLAEEQKKAQQQVKRAAREEADRMKAKQREEASRLRAAKAEADAEVRRKVEEAARAKKELQMLQRKSSSDQLNRMSAKPCSSPPSVTAVTTTSGLLVREDSDVHLESHHASSSNDPAVRSSKEAVEGCQGMSRSGSQGKTYGDNNTAGPSSSAAERRSNENASAEAQKGYSVTGLFGLNMLLTRIGFELLAGQSLLHSLKNIIQKRLDDFNRPPYLHPLKVESMDLGSTFPLIRDIRAVAGPLNCGPEACPWPQLVMDVAYSGHISLTVSTAVELQQAGLIKKLNAMFGKLQGLGTATEEPQHLDSPVTSHTTSSSTQKGTSCVTQTSMDPLSRCSSSSSIAGLAVHNAAAASSATADATASSSAAAAGAAVGGSGVFASLVGLTKAAAAKAGSLAAGLTESLPLIHFQLEIVITKFEAEVMLWTAPPPSDRLWFSFTAPPKVEMTTQPVLAHRVIRYKLLLSQVSSLVHGKLLKALNRQLVYPACADIRLGFFANPETAEKLQPFMAVEPASAASGQQQAASMALAAAEVKLGVIKDNEGSGGGGTFDSYTSKPSTLCSSSVISTSHLENVRDKKAQNTIARAPAPLLSVTRSSSSKALSPPTGGVTELLLSTASAAAPASPLPPKVPRPLPDPASGAVAGGALGKEAPPAAVSTGRRGISLAFRFRLFGRGPQPPLRGSSADGSTDHISDAGILSPPLSSSSDGLEASAGMGSRVAAAGLSPSAPFYGASSRLFGRWRAGRPTPSSTTQSEADAASRRASLDTAGHSRLSTLTTTAADQQQQQSASVVKLQVGAECLSRNDTVQTHACGQQQQQQDVPPGQDPQQTRNEIEIDTRSSNVQHVMLVEQNAIPDAHHDRGLHATNSRESTTGEDKRCHVTSLQSGEASNASSPSSTEAAESESGGHAVTSHVDATDITMQPHSDGLQLEEHSLGTPTSGIELPEQMSLDHFLEPLTIPTPHSSHLSTSLHVLPVTEEGNGIKLLPDVGKESSPAAPPSIMGRADRFKAAARTSAELAGKSLQGLAGLGAKFLARKSGSAQLSCRETAVNGPASTAFAPQTQQVQLLQPVAGHAEQETAEPVVGNGINTKENLLQKDEEPSELKEDISDKL